ncbi:MAG: hypothetical protein U1D55_00915 [Phycisphaerae bacterium]
MVRERALTQRDIYGTPGRPRADAEREVSIGAYARRMWRRRLAVGALGLGLIGSAAWLYAALTSADPKVPPGTRVAIVRCDSCGADERITRPIAEAGPAICPHCGKHTARELWRCRSCGADFVPNDGSRLVACPKCRSTAVGTAAGS